MHWDWIALSLYLLGAFAVLMFRLVEWEINDRPVALGVLLPAILWPVLVAAAAAWAAARAIASWR